MGFPTEFFPVLFAVPRMAGWLAHWKESLDDPDNKIMRPQQVSGYQQIYVENVSFLLNSLTTMLTSIWVFDNVIFVINLY
jgi:citrate synthase